ncbi:MAG TPA: PEP-CTERM sorting domain-containing protein [Candidatus Acidoferrales bacterium]|nr:PEP-CTERM sorting domain-containing protein [Candidatus Acidoferrales bacterium]
MKTVSKVSLLAVFALLLAFVPSASADTIELTGVGNNGSYDGIYVGPYLATVDGVQNTPVICDDFSHESSLWQPWSANLSTAPTFANVRFATGNYEDVAYLANLLFGVGGNNAEADALQFAIWYINDPKDVTNFLGASNPFLTDSTDIDGVMYWVDQAETYATPASLSNIEILTPCSGGDPQEFIVRTPEPSTVLLLALGLCGLFLLKRRKNLLSTAL